MHHKKGKLWLLMTIVAGLNQPLFADSADVIELLSVLKQNGVISEEQYQSLYDSQVAKIQQEQ
jgi:hypothetical protein